MAAKSSEISDYDRLRVESESMINHIKAIYQSMGVDPPSSRLSSRNEVALIGPHMGSHEWAGINKALNLCFAREKPLHGQSETVIDLNNWPTTAKSQKVTGYWPLPDDEFKKWRNNMATQHENLWKEIGIYDPIMLSTQQCKGEKNLFLAALCFWNTSSNTFDFPKGHMSISLLDVLVISGFPIHHKPYIAGLHHDSDFEERYYPNRKLASETCNSYERWVRFWVGKGDPEEHIAFLEMWLNKFVFCMNANKVTTHWKDMAIALHQGKKMSLGHQVLASLYRGLHQMVMSPLKFQSEGPFWLLHYWLLVYFPDFGSDGGFFPDKVMGEALVNVELPNQTVWDYFQAFRSNDYRPAWGKVVTRKYPHPLLDIGFFPDRRSKWNNADYYNMFRAAVCCKDLHYGGKLKQEKHLQMEVYAPSYFARQLGFCQTIPVPLISSMNHFTSWRRSLKTLATVEGISELGDSDPELNYISNTAKVHSVSGYEAWFDDTNKIFFSSSHLGRFINLFEKLPGIGALQAEHMIAPLSMRKELIMEGQALPTVSSLASDVVKAKLMNSIQADQDFIRRGHEKLRQEKLVIP
jgi:hypothetical protein